MIRNALPALLLLAGVPASTSPLRADDPVPVAKGPSTATEGAYADVKGQRLTYRISGSGPNLLLLHGGLSSSEDFDRVLPNLEKSFRVITVDRGGHGRSSDSGEPFAYSAMAEEMKAFLDVVGVTSTAILGWSDGGVVGYHLASRYPRLVTSLVAIGANTRVDGMAAETVAWIRAKSTPESLLADVPGVADRYRRLSPAPERLLDFLRRSRDLWLRDPYIAPDDLKRIEAPVLLLAGDTRDIRVEHLLEIRASLRQARLCILPGASHFLLQEKPHLLLPIVLDFLAPGLEAKDGPDPAGEARPAADSAARRSVTLPFTMDHNRMIVQVDFVRGDGTLRTARAWVDTGNPTLVLGEALARDLGFEAAPAEPGSAQPGPAWAGRTPGLLVGGMALDTTGVKTRVQSGSRTMPGVPAEANLPSAVLRSLHVVFDYPRRQLTLARPGVARPHGVALPCRVNAETGLFQVDVSVDGAVFALGVDNGSSYTWVSNAVTSAWEARHPSRPRSRGAVGTANFFGFPFEADGTLMRLPDLRLGELRARNVGVLGLPSELFDWYSGKSAGPVAGFLGANVLKGFRLEVDYPNRMTYWEAGPPPAADDLDTVGLTLRPEPNGSFTVAGVAKRDGAPLVEGIQPGDGIVQVGPLTVAGATMGEVASALGGAPGSTRSIVFERGGTRWTMDARVLRFP